MSSANIRHCYNAVGERSSARRVLRILPWCTPRLQVVSSLRQSQFWMCSLRRLKSMTHSNDYFLAPTQEMCAVILEYFSVLSLSKVVGSCSPKVVHTHSTEAVHRQLSNSPFCQKNWAKIYKGKWNRTLCLSFFVSSYVFVQQRKKLCVLAGMPGEINRQREEEEEGKRTKRRKRERLGEREESGVSGTTCNWPLCGTPQMNAFAACFASLIIPLPSVYSTDMMTQNY